ncbi:MAG: hypothetical protein O9312_09795 [Hylemonella sp.]|nr:hypothetical protein [Hylemonella sp.]
MRTLCTALTSLLISGAALAHDGHGATSTHWHATDLWGFVVFGALAVMVIWHLRK